MKKRAAVVIVAVLIAVALSTAAVAADDQTKGTDVKLTMADLTINVDSAIAGWGYYVDTDEPSVKHTELQYQVVVGSDRTVQIQVNGTDGLPAGWYLKADAVNCSYTIPENKNLVKVYGYTGTGSSVTLEAYIGTPVTVTFDSNGGSAVESQVIPQGSAAAEPAAPTRSGYTFLGWYNGTVKWNFADPVYEDMTLKASWRSNGGGGGSGSSKKVEPKVVDEITIDVDFQKLITVPAVDEDGNIVNLPIIQLIMTDPVTGTVYLGDETEYYTSITITPSLKETMKFIGEYRVETIEEALEMHIPVYENYIGGNGHAPVLVEDMSETIDPVQFYQVIEITTDVTGGTLQEIIFKVPLAELTEQGFTTTDVVLYHGVKEDSERIWYPLVTTLEWCDETYAYYAAKTDGASPFGILFLKDSTCMVPVSPVSPDEPVTPVETPVPVIGVLAGLLGAGAAVCMRGKKQ